MSSNILSALREEERIPIRMSWALAGDQASRALPRKSNVWISPLPRFNKCLRIFFQRCVKKKGFQSGCLGRWQAIRLPGLFQVAPLFSKLLELLLEVPLKVPKRRKLPPRIWKLQGDP
ncbi:uncharacterized protein LOC144790902 [Lissotriton helveticus]